MSASHLVSFAQIWGAAVCLVSVAFLFGSIEIHARAAKAGRKCHFMHYGLPIYAVALMLSVVAFDGIVLVPR